MDPKLWLLIEWVEDKNAFSHYGIINTNTLNQIETDLHNGKVVFVRDKNNGVRKAQILRISDSKRYLKDLKVMLERQDNQVKNVVSLCMNTIKEMKTGQMLLDSNEGRSPAVLNRTNKLPEQVETDSSDSDSDEEDHRSLNLTKSVVKHSNYQPKRSDSMPTGQMCRLLNDKTLFNNRKPLKSSTPLPERHVNENITLTFDQGTQTDPALYPETYKIEQLETVLRSLYARFLTLISDVQLKESNCLKTRTSEEQIYSEGNVPAITEAQYSNADFEMVNRIKSKALQVRRASAQTTNAGLLIENNADMVSIGSGNVTVPARLWANMDWSSHTSATRQLLQAVFPRRILATHSLTGKQSPAFVNKPPKQQLDPKLVDDIVSTVSERCGVPKRIVRSSITTKCTDEAKLYRNRLQQRKREHQIPENISPLPSSNESSNAKD